MGRRNINTTKSGKYMNPTDQASKYLAVPSLIKLVVQFVIIIKGF